MTVADDYMTPLAIMKAYRVGSSAQAWAAESKDLWSRHRQAMEALRDSIAREGVREPVLLGDDGRVQDGHRRIVAAFRIDPDMEMPVRR